MNVIFKKGSVTVSLKWCLTPFLLIVMALSGCTPVTYPESRAKQALEDILRTEYKITNIEVQFVGTTLGVFLSLDQLFKTDFKEAIMSGKVTNMESLFQPTEAAIDKIEDVLFSMSRVMLNTDKKIEFYYLQATDVEKTGMELTFIGQIDDVKRVRFWDIPRSEYRKRLIHDVRLNRAVLWHKPVRQFFQDLNSQKIGFIQTRYFPKTAEEKWTKEFLFVDPSGNPTPEGQAQWKILDIRSIPTKENEVIVYAKVQAVSKNVKTPSFSPQTIEYLFQVLTKEKEEKITRIIPFALLDQHGATAGLTLTKDMVYQNLPTWETEFKTPDIHMRDFLSRQLTRRFQDILFQDERIYNTFSNAKAVFRYHDKPEPYFLFNATVSLRGQPRAVYSQGQEVQEDVLYMLGLAVREFVEVLRSYDFKDYTVLRLQAGSFTADISKDNLELFRRHKKNLKDIFTLNKIGDSHFK